jgi:microcystin-dependent protein
MPNNFLGIYEAIVQDLSDPLGQGMARLLVPMVLGRASTAWSRPVMGKESVGGVKVGDRAWVVFEGGELSRPVWFAVNADAPVHSHAASDIASGVLDVARIPATAVEPTGVIHMWPTPTAPSGYLLCEGGTFLSTSYPALAALLGDTYGPHDGTTYFLPDFRSRSPIGIGGVAVPATGGNAYSLGQKWGDERLDEHNHTASSGNDLGDHSHSGTTAAETQEHTHDPNFYPSGWEAGGYGAAAAGPFGFIDRVGVTGNGYATGGRSATHNHTFTTLGRNQFHQHPITVNNFGTNHNMGNVHPVLGIAFIIKT